MRKKSSKDTTCHQKMQTQHIKHLRAKALAMFEYAKQECSEMTSWEFSQLKWKIYENFIAKS